MQFRLLDILADPDNPNNWPLKIKILRSENRNRSKEPYPHDETGLYCKFYCARKQAYLVENPLEEDEKPLSKDELMEIVTIEECKVCYQEEIIDAILFHENEGRVRYFIVDREIPVMYPDNLRDPKQEIAFFKRYPEEANWLEIEISDE